MLSLFKNPAFQGLLALLALLLAVLAYCHPVSEKKTFTKDFIVCVDEYEDGCGPHDKYIYCYQDPESEVKKSCQRYRLTNTRSGPGHKCGYTWYTYACTNDVP